MKQIIIGFKGALHHNQKTKNLFKLSVLVIFRPNKILPLKFQREINFNLKVFQSSIDAT